LRERARFGASYFTDERRIVQRNDSPEKRFSFSKRREIRGPAEARAAIG
jgi:hypothetical protein